MVWLEFFIDIFFPSPCIIILSTESTVQIPSKSNNPYNPLHMLNTRHEYGTINEIMIFLKSTIHAPSLIPYEQLFIQSHHQQGKLTAEQNPDEHNPFLQLAIDTTGNSHEHRSILP
jgi:hypothetical protein